MAVVLEAKNLTKIYGDATAVDHVSIAVEKGSLFGLLGPNGSGKTTMIKMLTGQTRPTSGSATVLGLECRKRPDRGPGTCRYYPGTGNPAEFPYCD